MHHAEPTDRLGLIPPCAVGSIASGRALDAGCYAHWETPESNASGMHPDPCAQIDGFNPRAAIGEFAHRLFDQSFGFRPRHQYAGPHREIEAPEFLMARDVGHGFARRRAARSAPRTRAVSEAAMSRPRPINSPGCCLRTHVRARVTRASNRALSIPSSRRRRAAPSREHFSPAPSLRHRPTPAPRGGWPDPRRQAHRRSRQDRRRR